MTTSTVNDWQTLHGRAIGQAYVMARQQEKIDTVLRHLSALSVIASLGAAVWLIGASQSLGMTAAALVLQVTCLATLQAAVPAITVVRAARHDLLQLGTVERTFHPASRQDHAETAHRPPATYAEAS
jgi:hypothetical protein